ncbi:MAG: intradiol ring-cleavage dioxygenase [Bacteroidetes bacterium]|jgi:protocatechuate 3,4-dioxygenase beta subunit|nr:intradiol ring-cleavage dioxygenase [Bacteroidota bacterium]
MNKIGLVCLVLWGILIVNNSCSQSNANQTITAKQTADNSPQDNCNWCGTSEAPKDVSWRAVIPPKGEPGEKLIISGTVFSPDGKTPAEGITVYVHHTNIEGVYPKKGNEKGNGKYHGYLRGWMKTDSLGRYEFETIRPTPYQTHGGEPAHIHFNIERPGYPEYWLTALWFDDDPRVTEEQLSKVQRSGGYSNVVTLTKDEHNVLSGTRNIILNRYDD